MTLPSSSLLAAATTSASSDQPASSSSPSTASPPLDLVAPSLVHLLSLHPFQSVPQGAVPLLGEIVHHYFGLLSRIASRNAYFCGRSKLNQWDIGAAIRDIGAADSRELKDWLQSDDRNDWADRVAAGWANKAAREQWENRKAAYREKRSQGIPTARAAEKRKMVYADVAEEHQAAYSQFQIDDEKRPLKALRRRHRHRDGQAASSHGNMDGDSPPATTSEYETDSDYGDAGDDGSSSSEETSRTSPSPPIQLLDLEAAAYSKRRLVGRDVNEDSEVYISYVPSFLPPFPGQNIGGPSSAYSSPVKPEQNPDKKDTDSHRAQEAHVVSASSDPVESKNGPADTATAAAPTADDAPTATASYFDEPSLFASSSMATLSDSETAARSLPSVESSNPSHQTTSHPSFVTAYTSLATADEAMGSLAATSARRQIAYQMANPAAYAPLDTLYGGISARPTALPFTPAPSHLITLPPDGGAPRFTPVRPRGRPLELCPSGISNPIMGFRRPSGVMQNLARTLVSQAPMPAQPVYNSTGQLITGPDPASAGVYGHAPVQSVLHRSLHIMDPEPLRDESHAERVFRGVALAGNSSDNALIRPESYLKAAVDSIAAVGAPLDDEEEEAGQAGAAKEKVRAGTIVYTWDWGYRDYAEKPTL